MLNLVAKHGSGEIYLWNKSSYYLAIWGFAIGAEPGFHNTFGTETGVWKWIGEELPDLKKTTLCNDTESWQPVSGFNLQCDGEDSVNWDKYDDDIFAIIERNERQSLNS